MRTTFATCILAALAMAATHAQQPATQRTPALEAWEAEGYGMFIHFGLNTFVGNECPGDESDAALFAPTALDVDQWARVAHDAGMKYAVLTTKHCTGHCLWPSKLTDFTVQASPIKTDIVRAFVDACRAHGVKPGFYYLLGWDAHHQHRMDPQAYEAFCAGQLTELLSNYGPIQQVFLDIPFDTGPDMEGVLTRLYARIKSLQPECLVLPNMDFSDGEGVVARRPTWMHKDLGKEPVAIWPRDLMDGERTLPPLTAHRPQITYGDRTYYLPMEVCDTLGENWFWIQGDTPRPTRLLYRLYSACHERGANLLLDVGPDRTGRIPDASVARLMELKEAIDQKRLYPRAISMLRPATASNTYRNDPRYGPDKAVDEAWGTRWATDDDQKTAWLEVDLGMGAIVESVYIREAYGRIRAFEIQFQEGDGWKTVHTGTTIGDQGVEIPLPPTRTPKIRLNITDAPGGPTIWDFEVHGRIVK